MQEPQTSLQELSMSIDSLNERLIMLEAIVKVQQAILDQVFLGQYSAIAPDVFVLVSNQLD